MSPRKKISIIGGGISGLSAAFTLFRLIQEKGLPLDFEVLESSKRLGGVISTRREGGFLIEEGPDSFLSTKPAAIELCKELGLDESLIPTRAGCRRTFVVKNGKLLPLPEGFIMLAPTRFLPFLKSPVLSWSGKLRVLMELLIPPSPTSGDESLGSFVRRRLGREVLERVVQPLASGIYTADPDKLSLRATMPQFLELERRYGGIIRGLLKETTRGARTASGARYSLIVSLKGGMSSLVDAISSALPEGVVRQGFHVKSIRFDGSSWVITSADGRKTVADGLIIAIPAHSASRLLADVSSTLSDELDSIEYSSTAIVNFALRRSSVEHPTDGFGFVVPASENIGLVACSFSSVKFENRTPSDADHILLRCFIGGASSEHMLNATDSQLEEAAFCVIKNLLGIRSKPLFSIVTRHPCSMPQYRVGHINRVERIERLSSELPAFVLAGNAYRGVGIPDCIASGRKATEDLLRRMGF